MIGKESVGRKVGRGKGRGVRGEMIGGEGKGKGRE